MGASNSFTAEQLDQIERMIDKAVTERTADLQAREQELLNQNLLFNAALTNMSQGLVMFDAEGRVIICNQRYLDMYGHTHVQPGRTLAELLRQRVETGSFAAIRWRMRRQSLRAQRPQRPRPVL